MGRGEDSRGPLEFVRLTGASEAMLTSGVLSRFTRTTMRWTTELLREDTEVVVWWGTLVECRSALARLGRERPDEQADRRSDEILTLLPEAWAEIQPGVAVRNAALRLLRVHDLRVADALQLGRRSSGRKWPRRAPAFAVSTTG